MFGLYEGLFEHLPLYGIVGHMGISIVMFQHDAVTEFTMMCFYRFCTLHSLCYHCKCSIDTDIQCSLCMCVCVIRDMRPSGKILCVIYRIPYDCMHMPVYIFSASDRRRTVWCLSSCTKFLTYAVCFWLVTVWACSSLGMFVIHCLPVQNIWSQLTHNSTLTAHIHLWIAAIRYISSNFTIL